MALDTAGNFVLPSRPLGTGLVMFWFPWLRAQPTHQSRPLWHKEAVNTPTRVLAWTAPKTWRLWSARQRSDDQLCHNWASFLDHGQRVRPNWASVPQLATSLRFATPYLREVALALSSQRVTGIPKILHMHFHKLASGELDHEIWPDDAQIKVTSSCGAMQQQQPS